MNLDPSSSRRRRPRRRNRYSSSPPLLRPLAGALLIAVLGLGWAAAGGGCSLAGGAGGVSSAFLSPVERQERAEARVDAALERMRKAETAEADGELAAAVGLMDPQGAGHGHEAVARMLLRHGTPEAMVALMGLLEPATRDEKHSWDPQVWSLLALAAEKSGDPDRARRARSEAASRAEALVKQGEAAAFALTATNDKPADPAQTQKMGARVLRAGLYYSSPEQHDLAGALRAYDAAERLLAAHPDALPVLLNAKGYALADLGTTPAHFDEAVTLTRRALEAAPGEPHIRDSYGWALFKRNNKGQKDLEAARRVLREAVDAAPYEAELRLHLGAVYAALGAHRDAALELNRAAVLDPSMARRVEPAVRGLPTPFNNVGGPVPLSSPSPSPSTSVSPSPTPSASPVVVPSPSPAVP